MIRHYDPTLTRQLFRFIVRNSKDEFKALVATIVSKGGRIGGYHYVESDAGVPPPVFVDDTEEFLAMAPTGEAFVQLDKENGWETCGVWMP